LTSFGPLLGVRDPLQAPYMHITYVAGHRPTPHRAVQVLIYRSKMLPHGSGPPKTLVQISFLSKNSTPGPRYGQFTVSPSVFAASRKSGRSRQPRIPPWSVPLVQSSTQIIPKRFRTPKNLSPDTTFVEKFHIWTKIWPIYGHPVRTGSGRQSHSSEQQAATDREPP
jgi:hypothetical protein